MVLSNFFCKFVAMKMRAWIFAACWAVGALGGFAQSDTTFRFQSIAPMSIASKIIPSPQISIITPNIVAPKLNNYTPPEPLKLDYKFSQLSDSLKSTPELSVKPQVYRAASEFDFRGNPFSRDWSAGGEVLRLDQNLSLIGSGSYTAYPALGNIGTGSLGLQAKPIDRLTLGVGANVVKYHMGRSAWNDFGLYVNGSYQLTDALSVNAFGQYYFDQRYHSVGGMGLMQNAVYGGTLGYKFSDSFSLAVGAQRYYDAYTHTWRTVPIVAPTFKIFGAPLTVDVGGLIYNIVEALIYNSSDSHSGYAMPSGGSLVNPASQFKSRRAQGGDIR